MTDLLQRAKNSIRQELEVAVRAAASESASGVISPDVNQAVCNAIEAVFIHGLQDAFFLKGSRYSKYPEPNFWPFVSKFTHRSIKQQINNQNQIKNEIGKARTWVRIVLNEGALENYIQIISKDVQQLSQFYCESAFLRDVDKVETLNGYLKALAKIPLNAPTNSTFLNNWTPSPLILAGLTKGKVQSIKLADSPEEEIDYGIDANLVAQKPRHKKKASLASMDKEEDRASTYSHPSMVESANKRVPSSIASNASDDHGYTPSPDTAEVVVRRTCNTKRKLSQGSNRSSCSVSQAPSLNCLNELDSGEKNGDKENEVKVSPINIFNEPKNLKSEDNVGTLKYDDSFVENNIHDESVELEESFAREGDFDGTSILLEQDESINLTYDDSFYTQESNVGNGLLGREWSSNGPNESMERLASSLETSSSEPLMNFGVAMKEALGSHAESRKTSVATSHTPDIFKDDEIDDVFDKDEIVVIEHEQLPESEENDLLSKLTLIPHEQGLEYQNFRCLSCRKSIGGSFGNFRTCNFNCKYYCESCFKKGTDTPIPSRIILNWDHRHYAISQDSKKLLSTIYDRPVIYIDRVNPGLYEQAPALEKIRSLRVKLSLIAMYLLSCKQSVAEDLKRRLWPSDYLYTDIHLYSVKDLENVASGVLERRLNTVISFAVDHVTSCVLCIQKGFVCEICNSPKVIYPFQIDITYRCQKCFSVYHQSCMANKECPRCLRHRQNAERLKSMSSF